MEHIMKRSRVESIYEGAYGYNKEEQELLCPGCHGHYVHTTGLYQDKGPEEYTCPLGTRGDWTAHSLECEACSCKWRLVLGFHKGSTFIGYVIDEGESIGEQMDREGCI